MKSNNVKRVCALLLGAAFITGLSSCSEEDGIGPGPFILDFKAYLEGEWEVESATYHAQKENLEMDWEGTWLYRFEAEQAVLSAPDFPEDAPAYTLDGCLPYTVSMEEEAETFRLTWETSYGDFFGHLMCQQLDPNRMHVLDVNGWGQYPEGAFYDLVLVRKE